MTLNQPSDGSERVPSIEIQASLIVSRERLRLALLALRGYVAQMQDDLDPHREEWRP